MLRKRLPARVRRLSKQNRTRAFFLEPLEQRLLMAADWRNPADATDVDSNGTLEPLDAINCAASTSVV